ncbi:hypothetical protein ABB37_03567 [Leptomonas pyrrhocoris]|uniref:Uncharacterized protein n=1 Tax=Leptomonas pyrrhocoris TaxID=157538 RepID=A0A0N1J517_LEPPY|nr:hypothetical protein ABB37_03567 [Leptomonas pyrrhocoris]XP_015660955.1 hypothetical protein ABB37_03567 [Leptomonas pyrrhocoris]XP_015660956.1 hypothetical protein ABB37_03567 [Leptomonas pyrrhocoris]XP_015660957.1 hypothetical protein ABB37_03567 [Leptomonas pyrrhocoris]KPA82515.1 hypothetical protein ABB37_03567 [Leptomonas pyrrhocoris]KPA82516.1 hypothetical protein ABB37_03567 [Leptomonas pyrrhocoris]KPA82517.1 hypothetical protein ABB37_03567 [Leptomonas pyrrhocoris]KPA82518.1 hypot|eukprot:XP_015660954.1 hypothetical protein ABB37_03567 [Leptomonas pyrrhocoris]
MHLSHTIPWNQFSRHFEFIRENKAIYGQPTAIFPKKDEHEVSDGLHFARVFADTVDEFAVTERKKFPAKMDMSVPLFADELLDPERFHLSPYSSNDNSCIPLNEDMQQVSFWKKESENGFSTEHGYLADAVKFLIQQHQSGALLTLCQAVPLQGLFNLHWGHGFGVYLLAYHSFRIYVFLNLVYSVQQDLLTKGKKAFKIFDVPALKREVLELFSNNDYSAQYIAHRQFWDKYVQNPRSDMEGTVFQDPAEVDPADLKQYLANCFRDIYLYDMMLKECGQEKTKEFWVNDFILTLNFMFQPLSLPTPE